MLTLNQTKKLVGEKKDYYNGLERNGVYLPDYKSSIIT